MSGLLLLALAMVNVPVYLLLGRRLFGAWDRFVAALRLWLTATPRIGPWEGDHEQVSADVRLGVFLAGSAAVVLGEFFLLGQFVFHLPA